MRYGVANQKQSARIYTTSGEVTSGTTSAYLSKDGGASIALSNATYVSNIGWVIDTGAASNTQATSVSLSWVNNTSGALPVTKDYDPTPLDPADSVRAGLTALPNAAATADGGLFTRGTGAGQIYQDVNGTITVKTTYLGASSINAPVGTLNIPTGTLASTTNITNASIDDVQSSAVLDIWNVSRAAGFNAGSMGIALQNTLDGSGNITGSLTGNVAGKVLGGGAGTITGTGVRAVDENGERIANYAQLDDVHGDLQTELANVPTAAENRAEMDANSTKLANLDATVTSRAPAATALSTATWTGTMAGYLDTAVSSRLASASYTEPPSVGAIRTEMDDNSAKLANLNATISSRAAASDLSAMQTDVDNLLLDTSNISGQCTTIQSQIANLGGGSDLLSIIAPTTVVKEGSTKAAIIDIHCYGADGSPFDPPDLDYARFDVTSVDGNGAVTGLAIASSRDGRGLAANQTITDGASAPNASFHLRSGTAGGSGLIVTINTVDENGAILTWTITNGGSGYNADNLLDVAAYNMYDGCGVVAKDQSDNAVTLYTDSGLVTQATTQALCYHTAQGNPPQSAARVSAGNYRLFADVSEDVTAETLILRASMFGTVGDTSTHYKKDYVITLTLPSSGVPPTVEEIRTELDTNATFAAKVGWVTTQTEYIREILATVNAIQPGQMTYGVQNVTADFTGAFVTSGYIQVTVKRDLYAYPDATQDYSTQQETAIGSMDDTKAWGTTDFGTIYTTDYTTYRVKVSGINVPGIFTLYVNGLAVFSVPVEPWMEHTGNANPFGDEWIPTNDGMVPGERAASKRSRRQEDFREAALTAVGVTKLGTKTDATCFESVPGAYAAGQIGYIMGSPQTISGASISRIQRALMVSQGISSGWLDPPKGLTVTWTDADGDPIVPATGHIIVLSYVTPPSGASEMGATVPIARITSTGVEIQTLPDPYYVPEGSTFYIGDDITEVPPTYENRHIYPSGTITVSGYARGVPLVVRLSLPSFAWGDECNAPCLWFNLFGEPCNWESGPVAVNPTTDNVQTLVDASLNTVSNITYNVDGTINVITWSDGSTWTHTYNVDGKLTEIVRA